jgi:hypothetical protein
VKEQSSSSSSSSLSSSSLIPTSSAALDLLRAASNTSESAYVAHARFIISHVLSSPATRHLFTEHELALFTKFQSLSPQAAGLAIRVFQRKGPWLRTSTLRRYAEDLAPDDVLSSSSVVDLSQDIFDPKEILISEDIMEDFDDKISEEVDQTFASAPTTSTPMNLPVTFSQQVMQAQGTSSLFRIIDTERNVPGSVSGKAMAERLAKKKSAAQTMMSIGNNKREEGGQEEEEKREGGYKSQQVPAIWVQNAVAELVSSGIARGLPNSSPTLPKPLSSLPKPLSSQSKGSSVAVKPTKPIYAPIFKTPKAATLPVPKSIYMSTIKSPIPATEVKLPFSLEEILAAISCAFTADELRSVAQRLGLPNLKSTGSGGSSSKTSGGSSAYSQFGSVPISASGRSALISQINTCMRTQRSVMGGPLPLLQAFLWVLSRPGTVSFDYAAEVALSRPGSSTSKITRSATSSSTKSPFRSSILTPREDKSFFSSSTSFSTIPQTYHLIRLQPSFSSLLRRAHCLFYIAPSSAMLSSGMGSGSWPFADEADADDEITESLVIDSITSSSSSSNDTVCIIDVDVDDDIKVSHPVFGIRSLETIPSFRPNFEDHLSYVEDAARVQNQQYSPSPSFLQGSMSKYTDSAAAESPLLLALSSKAQSSISSPGLALIFRKLDVCPSITPRPLRLFNNRFELSTWEFANLFRGQADARNVFSYLPIKVSATDAKANRAEDITEKMLHFPWEEEVIHQRDVLLSVKDNIHVDDDIINIDDDDDEVEEVDEDTSKSTDEIRPPLLAGMALLPFGLQLLGVSPSHPLTNAVLSCRDSKLASRLVLEATLKIDGNLGTLGTGPSALFGVGAASLLFLMKSMQKFATLVADGVVTTHFLSLSKARAISEAIFSSSPALLVAYRASLCLALHTVSRNLLSTSTSSGSSLRTLLGTSLDNHSFLHQFSAGSLYSTILWEAIDPLERSKNYLLATLFLSQLTAPTIESKNINLIHGGRFTPHRSGRWWTRLSLNLSHLGLHFDSLFVSQESLRCTDVRAGDRYLLSERCKKLKDTIDKRQNKKTNKEEGNAKASSLSDIVLSSKQTAALYIPLYDEIIAWSTESSNCLRAFPTIYDSFVHAPLATAVGAKSSFLSSIDIENDGDIEENIESDFDYENNNNKTNKRLKTSLSIPTDLINITVQVFQLIGMDYSILGQPTFCMCKPVWIAEREKLAINEQQADMMTSEIELNYNKEDVIINKEDVIINESLPIEINQSSSQKVTEEPSDLSRRWIKTSDGRSIAVKSKQQQKERLVSLPMSSMRVNVEELSLLFYNNPLDAAIPQADETDSIQDDILKFSPGLNGGGWRGVHCEGGPIRSLFALFFWDILFPISPEDAPIGAFVTAFQDAPLDLDSPGVFYSSRQALITRRIQEITKYSQIELCREVGRSWRSRYGQVCRGMKWTGLPMQALQVIAMGLGGPSIACLCSAFCFDYRHLTGGMPDLLLWRIKTCADTIASFSFLPSVMTSGDFHGPDVDFLLPNILECSIEVRLVEVKGPRDHLSEKQIVWLRILDASGIDHGVVKILESRKSKSATKTAVKRGR